MVAQDFLKYMHVERLDTVETYGIDVGFCHIFPKIDGTNASVWLRKPGVIGAGSRGRLLSDERDNFGFNKWVQKKDEFKAFFDEYPDLRLYGEFLVPHTFKHYREDAWRNLYIFDVYCHEQKKLLPYDQYNSYLEKYNLTYIEPLAIIKNPTKDQLLTKVETNTYLVKDGEGPGEGIVIKNYDWQNKFGRQTWAKIVRNEFKEDNKRAFGVREIDGGYQAEAAIAEEFVTSTLVNKERAKIEGEITNQGIEVNSREGRKILIPRLLQTVFYCVVKEEMWDIIKKYKDPNIDFKRLRRFVAAETKVKSKDLF